MSEHRTSKLLLTGIGRRLRAARVHSRRSMLSVEAETGITHATQTRIEHARGTCRLSTLKLLADTYGVSLDWLCGRPSPDVLDGLHPDDVDIVEAVIATLRERRRRAGCQ